MSQSKRARTDKGRPAMDPVAASILRHFRSHPDCIDDLDGIAHWRLLEEKIDRVVSETAHALDVLVARGLLVRIDTPGLRQRYRLPMAKPKR